MRVLLVNKFLAPRGGVETYVFALGRLLEGAGHEVQYYGMDEPGRVVGNAWGIYAPAQELGGVPGIARVVDVAATIDSRENARRLRKLLERFAPDVVHFNNISYYLTPAVIREAARYREASAHRVTLVMTMHDYHAVVPCDGCFSNRTFELCDACLDGTFGRCARRGCVRGGRAKSVVAAIEATYWARRDIYAQLDVAICPSRALEERYIASRTFHAPTVHLSNFTNLPRRTYPKERYVVYAGGYYRNKGMEQLLAVACRHPEVTFKLAGRGGYAAEIAALPNVEDQGFLTGEPLYELIGRAALSVLPATGPENSPFAVLEALALGTPVLASRVGGIPELIDEGVTGELCAFRDEADFERKLVALWNDPARLARYAAQCASFDPMSGERYVARVLELYQGGARDVER